MVRIVRFASRRKDEEEVERTKKEEVERTKKEEEVERKKSKFHFDRVRLFCKNDIEHHTYNGSKCVLSVPPTDLSIDSLPIRQTIQVKEPSNAYSFITPEDPCKKRKCYLKMDAWNM